MKTLFILRHGKAEVSAVGGDKKRTLKARGRRDAAVMGELIGELALPDWVVSSDAARARQTAEIASEAFGFDGEIEIEPAIYGAGLDGLIQVVRDLPNKANSALLVGHNPGFEDLSWSLAAEGTPPITLPTAAFAHLEFDVARWRDVKPGNGRLAGVHTPKDEA